MNMTAEKRCQVCKDLLSWSKTSSEDCLYMEERIYAVKISGGMVTLVEAANPDEEIALLGSIDLRHQAVVTAPVILNGSEESDSIELTSYAPNELHYRYTAASDRLAVFSEIYYPNGWHATVDGTPVDLMRANWTFRAALLPAGEHEVVMTFLPDSYKKGAGVSRASSIGLLLLLLLSLGMAFVPCKKKA